MKKTCTGINEVMNCSKKKSKPIFGPKRLNGNGVTCNLVELPNVLNDFFSTVGQKQAVISSDIESEISLLQSKKLYSCPIRVLKCTKNILSSPLAELKEERSGFP